MDPQRFVRIYDLTHVDLTKNRTKFPYVGSEIATIGILCAMAAIRRKFLLLAVADAQALNTEQEKILSAYEQFTTAVDNLKTSDGDESDEKKWNTDSAPFEAFVFLVERNLMNPSVNFGVVTEDRIDAIKKYAEGSGDEQAARTAVSAMKFNRTQMALFGDLLRAYGDSVSGALSECGAMLQLEMQYYLQDVTTATSLLARMETMRAESNSRIR